MEGVLPPAPQKWTEDSREPKRKAKFWELLSNLPIIGSTNNPLVVEPDASNQLFVAF